MSRDGEVEGELLEAIRRDKRFGKSLSIRGLADRLGCISTVRQALASALPPERRVPQQPAPRLYPVKGLIDAMLRVDLDARAKQRHTARHVHICRSDRATTGAGSEVSVCRCRDAW